MKTLEELRLEVHSLTGLNTKRYSRKECEAALKRVSEHNRDHAIIMEVASKSGAMRNN